MQAGTALTILLIIGIGGIGSATATVSAEPVVKFAPPGSNYDPDYEPRMDPNSSSYDPDYNPQDDPDHPSKQQTDPGEAWDNPRRADGTPSIRRAFGDWAWGELTYGQTYKTKLTVTNQCGSSETVSLTAENLPYLTVPETVTIPGKSQKEIDLTITTPAPPAIPLLTGHETIPPGGFFTDIKGDKEMLKVWHPWNGDCMPKRETYKVTGHIHYADADKDPGPQRIALATPCQVYWNTGERPANLDEDCTEEFLVLALHYRERVLQGHATGDPKAWAWLPSAPEIRTMTAAEMLAMKARADAQIRQS